MIGEKLLTNLKEYMTYYDPERWVDSDMTRNGYLKLTLYYATTLTLVAIIIGTLIVAL